MRKLIWIAAALILASTAAEARQARSLARITADAPAATDQAKPADTIRTSEVSAPPAPAKPVDAPKSVEPPAAPAAAQSVSQPATTQSAAVAVQPAARRTATVARRRHGDRDWTEARIISELHRHGIYW